MFAFILDRAQSLVPYFRILDRARDDYCRVFYHSAYFPEESDDEDLLEDDEPDLDTVMIQHNGAINRIRVSFEHGVAYLFVNILHKNCKNFSPPKFPLTIMIVLAMKFPFHSINTRGFLFCK